MQVALVGYSVSKDIFYIKDSNHPYLLKISPRNLLLSMHFELVLVPNSHLDFGHESSRYRPQL